MNDERDHKPKTVNRWGGVSENQIRYHLLGGRDGVIMVDEDDREQRADNI